MYVRVYVRNVSFSHYPDFLPSPIILSLSERLTSAGDELTSICDSVSATRKTMAAQQQRGDGYSELVAYMYYVLYVHVYAGMTNCSSCMIDLLLYIYIHCIHRTYTFSPCYLPFLL